MEVFLLSDRIKSMNSDRVVCSAVLTYHTRNAEPEKISDEEVLAAVLDAAPAVIGCAGLENAEIVEYHGGGVYEIEVHYEQQTVEAGSVKFANRKAYDERWYLDSSNTVEHILAGESTTAYGPDAPEVGNLINWNGKHGAACVISGADIISTTIRENCVLSLDTSSYTTGFRKKIANLAGSINSRAFHGWAAGEVLFLGADSGNPYVNRKGEELIDVTLKFAIRISSGKTVNGRTVSAGGWDVVWPLGTKNVFVSKVYRSNDLNMLGVG